MATENMGVRGVRLPNGEVLIGEVLKDKDGNLTVRKPVAINVGVNPNTGVPVAQLLPWHEYLIHTEADGGGATFTPDDYTFVREVDPRLAAKYQEATNPVAAAPSGLNPAELEDLQQASASEMTGGDGLRIVTE